MNIYDIQLTPAQQMQDFREMINRKVKVCALMKKIDARDYLAGMDVITAVEILQMAFNISTSSKEMHLLVYGEYNP